MKVCTLISSHSDPVYTKLTVRSLLDTVGKNHDVKIHIGIHSNYDDYSQDFTLMREFEDICHFHVVDEIDWMAHFSDTHRYSKMHAKNLENLLKNVKFYEFDCLLILDNDLHIKEDFVTRLYSGEDITAQIYSDEILTITENDGRIVDFMPKFSAWNMIFSRKAYDKMIENLDSIRPELIDGEISKTVYGRNNPVFFDTLAKIHYYADEWGLSVKVIPKEEMEECIYHFFGSSFNYGSRFFTEERRDHVLNEAKRIYESEYVRR